MNKLLEKEQELSIVPQDFTNSNKGKVIEVLDQSFSLELFHDPEGIEPKKMMEFYSPTKNGTLYFSASINTINGKVLEVLMPLKHRFLQRRAFTRVNFSQDMELKFGNDTCEAISINLSAGGMKLKTDYNLDIDTEYDLFMELSENNFLECTFQPIKIEKNENGSYTLSGRFKNLSNIARMKLIQFCIRKNLENINR